MGTATDQFLNQISMLIFGWEIVDFVTMINQKSTYQPKINQLSTKFQPFFNTDISTSNLVDFWLNCGREVVFWLIIVTKSTICQPNINVDIWLRNRWFCNNDQPKINLVACRESGTPKGWRNNTFLKTAAQIWLPFHNPLPYRSG